MKKNSLVLGLVVVAAFITGYFLSMPKTDNGFGVQTTVIEKSNDVSTQETIIQTETETAVITTDVSFSSVTESAATAVVTTAVPSVTTAAPVSTTTQKILASEEGTFTSEQAEMVGNVTFSVETGVSKKDYKEIKDIYLSFPERLKCADKIVITNDNLAVRFNFKTRTPGGVIGGASTGKVVYISTLSKTRTRTFAHELGHCVDCKLGWISQTDTVHNIYVKDYPALSKEDINFYNEKEYLATSTAMYFTNPQHLKDVAPKTYEFLEQTLV